MLENMSNYMASHQPGAYRAQFADFVLQVNIGTDSRDLRFAPDGVDVRPSAGDAQLSFAFSEADWQSFLAADAPVGYQSLSAMAETGKLSLGGDLQLYFRHILFLEGAFQSLRNKPQIAPAPLAEASVEPIVGRYLRLNLDGVPHRIYFEEAGEGIPLLCLHTAGADGRQYRELLNSAEVTSRFRVIVFDLPWHGKSSPPAGFQQQIYQLTTDKYVDTVMAVKQALDLEQPVVMGCSIGGRAVLHLALRHGDEFRAAIGLQSATHAESRFGEELTDM
ncbi:MAG: alpha/beta fold hydrolase [Pseudomonadota bacterium]